MSKINFGQDLEGLVYNGQNFLASRNYGLIAVADNTICALGENGSVYPLIKPTGTINCICPGRNSSPELVVGIENQVFLFEPMHIADFPNGMLQIGVRDSKVTSMYMTQPLLVEAGDHPGIFVTNLSERGEKKPLKVNEEDALPGATRLLRYGDDILGLAPKSHHRYKMSLNNGKVRLDKAENWIDMICHNNDIYVAEKRKPHEMWDPQVFPCMAIIRTYGGGPEIARRPSGGNAILHSTRPFDGTLFDAVGQCVYSTLDDPDGKKPLWNLGHKITSMTSLPLEHWEAFVETAGRAAK